MFGIRHIPPLTGRTDRGLKEQPHEMLAVLVGGWSIVNLDSGLLAIEHRLLHDGHALLWRSLVALAALRAVVP